MQQRDDERRDVAIAVILALTMVAGVWLYATRAGQGTPAAAPRVGVTDSNEPAPITAMAGAAAPERAPLAVMAAAPAPSWSDPGRKGYASIPAAPAAVARTAPAPEVPPVEPAVVQPSASPVTEVAVAQPAPPPVTEPPATLVIPPPPTQPRIVVSESFEFATGSAVIPASAIARLDEIAGLLRNDQRTLTIAGHTDNTGDAAVNSELSQRRAEAVLRHLVSRGVPAAQLKARGMGQDQPVADNATAEGRARNRRIEIAE